MHRKKKLFFRFAFLLSASLILVILFSFNRTDRIITALPEGEIVPRVSLTDGSLWFKTGSEIEDSLTKEDRESARLGALDLTGYERIPLPAAEDRAVWEALLDLHPEEWCWQGERGGAPYDVRFEAVGLHVWPERGKVGLRSNISPAVLLTYTYRDESGASISVQIGSAEAELLSATGSDAIFGSGLSTVRDTYGHRDSVVGKNHAALCYSIQHTLYGVYQETDPVVFMAEFALGETRYMLRGWNVEERDFVEFLLSVCDSSQAVTEGLEQRLFRLYPEVEEEVKKLMEADG